MLAHTLLSIALVLVIVVSPARGADDWPDTPEASFLTRDERRAWKRLATVEQRAEFTREYWRRRDPTPGTEINEFHAQVLARIHAADARFGTPGRRGSRTARGLVYVVLGPPAIVRTTSGPLESTPQAELPGVVALPRTALHANAWEEWVYNREHHAELLKALKRPTVEVSFVIEPGQDQLQKPGVFAAYRELLARSTIVSPEPGQR